MSQRRTTLSLLSGLGESANITVFHSKQHHHIVFYQLFNEMDRRSSHIIM